MDWYTAKAKSCFCKNNKRTIIIWVRRGLQGAPPCSPAWVLVGLPGPLTGPEVPNLKFAGP
jgi:hypothetical protein